jgi:hypothetical protein
MSDGGSGARPPAAPRHPQGTSSNDAAAAAAPPTAPPQKKQKVISSPTEFHKGIPVAPRGKGAQSKRFLDENEKDRGRQMTLFQMQPQLGLQRPAQVSGGCWGVGRENVSPGLDGVRDARGLFWDEFMDELCWPDDTELMCLLY